MNGHKLRGADRAGVPAAADLGQQAAIMGGATLVVLPVYTLLFWKTLHCPLGEAAIYALTNTIPLVLLVLPFSLAIRMFVRPLPSRAQAASHALLAPAFVAGWYGGIVVFQALVRTAQGHALELHNFAPEVLAWQAFQGVVVYVAIAATTYALDRPATQTQGEPSDRLERYLTRQGDMIAPVDVRDIVSISGAQDYSEVATLSGRHLARFSLAAFEQRLDPGRFLRIHRSAIINLDHFRSAEPAGNGRFLILLSNGETMQTSRAGARKLRAMTY